MPFNMHLCLGFPKKKNRKLRNMSNIVKVHTDETTSIKLSSAGSSVASFPSFVPSVTLRTKDTSTPPRKDCNHEGSKNNLVENQPLSLRSNTNDEGNITTKNFSIPDEISSPYKVQLPNENMGPNDLFKEDRISKEDPLLNDNNKSNESHLHTEETSSNNDSSSYEDNLLNEDQQSSIAHSSIENNAPDENCSLNEDITIDKDHSSNEEIPYEKEHSFNENKISMNDNNTFDEHCKTNEDHTHNKSFSTNENTSPSEEHLPTTSSMNAILESSSSLENEYARISSCAVQGSSSVEKQNYYLHSDVNSSEGYLSPLIDNLEDMSSSSKTTLPSPMTFASLEDVKIIPVMNSPCEYADVLSFSISVKEERAEVVEIEWKSPMIVEPRIIKPVEIVEHDNTADYLELEYDNFVPGQPIDDLKISNLNDYEELIEELTPEFESDLDDQGTGEYLDVDDDKFVPNQSTADLKILCIGYDNLHEKNSLNDETSTLLESEYNACDPGQPVEDIKILHSGHQAFNETVQPLEEEINHEVVDEFTAFVESQDNSVVSDQQTDDLKFLLSGYKELNNEVGSDDEASNDELQNKSDSHVLKHPIKEIPCRQFDVSFDTNLSAGDSNPSTVDLQCQTNESSNQQDSFKIEKSEQFLKEETEVSSRTDDCDYSELENPIDWCGDFASSVFESENDKKSVASDRSETEMAEINDIIYGKEEMASGFPISRKGQLGISERQRKFRSVLQNIIDAQKSSEFQSLFNVNALRVESLGGSSGKKKILPNVNNSPDPQSSHNVSRNSEGNMQSPTDGHGIQKQPLNDGTLEMKNEARNKESSLCDESVEEMVDKLPMKDDDITYESPRAENARVIISKWRSKFRNALHKLIDMKNSAENQSTPNSNPPLQETDEDNTDSDCENALSCEIKGSTDRQCSIKEDTNSEGKSCSQDDNTIMDKRSHSILNSEDLNLLEKGKNKDRTDTSVQSNFNEGKDSFKFKRAGISETGNLKQNTTPKRKVIDQVIESTRNHPSPNFNTDNNSLDHKKSGSSVNLEDNGENKDFYSLINDRNSDSTNSTEFMSHNKLKNALERFIQKAEEYNKMLCKGKTRTMSINDLADKIKLMDIDHTRESYRNTCADKLIKQSLIGKDGNESCNLKKETDQIMLSSYSVDSLDTKKVLEESVSDNEDSFHSSIDVSCSSSTFNPCSVEQQNCVKPAKQDTSKSIRTEFVLDLNLINRERSFERNGDFAVSSDDGINGISNTPPQPTIKSDPENNNMDNNYYPTNEHSKSVDDEYLNLEPQVVEELEKSHKVFNQFMKQALEPLGPNIRIIPIKRTESITLTFSGIENALKEKAAKFEKNGIGSKLLTSEPSANAGSLKKKHDGHSPKYVHSPTSFKTYRIHNNAGIAGSEKTSIAKRFLEASNAFKSWRSSFVDRDEISNSIDYGKHDGERGNNAKENDFEMLQKRYDAVKGKRDIEKMERIEKFIDFSNSQLKSARRNGSDYFGDSFDGLFRRYAKKGSSCGDLITYKQSTDWLLDAGVAGTNLTVDEANKMFKRIAGVKVTLNKQDYKRFLYKLSRLKRMSYNEIYDRLCRCADFPA